MESNEGNSEENMLVTKSTGGGGGCDNSVTVKTSYQRSDLLKTKNSPGREGESEKNTGRCDAPTAFRRLSEDVAGTS